MRKIAAAFALSLLGTSALAQRPSDPALLIPETAPELDYVPVPAAVTLPAGTTMGATASVAFDAKGHLFVLTRGATAFFEFDPNGTFVRSFGDGLFTRSHGLRIDGEGNLWATDVGGHVVVKFNPAGQALLTLGTKGRGRRVERGGGIAQAESAQRCRHRAQRGRLRGAGTHARTERRRTRAQVRQDRPVHQVVGREGQGPGSIRGRARNRHRCPGAAVGDGPREPAHSDLRCRGHVHQGDQIRRTAVQRRYRPPVHLHGQRLRRSGAEAGPERQSPRRDRESPEKARANSARRTSSPSARKTSCTSPTRSTARS